MNVVYVLALCAVVVAATATPKATHNIQRRQLGTCPSGIDRKDDALHCQADYLEAWRNELDASRCINDEYTDERNSGSNTLCTLPHYIDETMRDCYSDCGIRQYLYMECSNLGSQFRQLESECEISQPRYPRCFHYGGDFCELKGNQTYQVFIECYATNTPPASGSSDDFTCTSRCRDAVNAYVANTGCCIATDYGSGTTWNETSYGGGLSIFQIFSRCNIQIPGVCTEYTPPANGGYLDCAREGALSMASPTSLLMIISAAVSLLLAPFM